MNHRYYHLLLLIFFSFSLITCHGLRREKDARGIDLEQIKQHGKLVAVTDYSTMNYFIYRGQPLGFQYELLQEFANYLGMEIELRINKDLEESVRMLRAGEVDLIAMNLTVTNERRKYIEFTLPLSQTRQVLVQRIPNKTSASGIPLSSPLLVREHFDLARDEVQIFIQKNSAYIRRLKHLSDEIGDSIHIYEVKEDAEELIELVANGDIDYTVADENVARVNSTWYPNIDFQTPVSFEQNLAWALRKDAVNLKNEFNNWFASFSKTSRYAVIYQKYFENPRISEMVNSDYFVLKSGKISEYDELIRAYSKKINWDWTLLASLIYQESHFNPKARSWAGAYGLMQLMPSVIENFRVLQPDIPEQSLNGGVKLIAWIDNQLGREIQPEDRIKFILAAYNIGLGHVLDARRLAEKYNKDPNRWEENVEYFLSHKNNPQYYKDPVVRNGYCKGVLATNYVKEVLERYGHYRTIMDSAVKK